MCATIQRLWNGFLLVCWLLFAYWLCTGCSAGIDADGNGVHIQLRPLYQPTTKPSLPPVLIDGPRSLPIATGSSCRWREG